MVRKKVKKDTKTKKPKKTSTKSLKKQNGTKAKGKNKNKKLEEEDTSIIVIEDDLEVNKDAVLEERKAYLEEAKSQEALD